MLKALAVAARALRWELPTASETECMLRRLDRFGILSSENRKGGLISISRSHIRNTLHVKGMSKCELERLRIATVLLNGVRDVYFFVFTFPSASTSTEIRFLTPDRSLKNQADGSNDGRVSSKTLHDAPSI